METLITTIQSKTPHNQNATSQEIKTFYQALFLILC